MCVRLSLSQRQNNHESNIKYRLVGVAVLGGGILLINAVCLHCILLIYVPLPALIVARVTEQWSCH
jgi:ABC-type uncharacterized transport system permease subunit